MNKKRILFFRGIILQILLAVFICGCSPAGGGKSACKQGESPGKPAMQLGRGGKLSSIPLPDDSSKSFFQVDLRSYDLAHLNLKKSLNSLMSADFDTGTRWPYGMPSPFDPKKIMSMAKEPGLNIKKLHSEGITGKGISVAVIGPSLLAGHREFARNLRYYEEVECTDKTATVEGCIAASVLAGESCGVAPEADLYYFAYTYIYSSAQGEAVNLEKTARVLERLVEVNSTLDEKNKIKAAALCVKWEERAEGAARLNAALDAAQKDGIFVMNDFISYRCADGNISIRGLGREPLSDPNSFEGYRPAWSWETPFYLHERTWSTLYALLLPMDSKAGAAPTGAGDYAFYRYGTHHIPLSYAAGLYALACQSSPGITPGRFLEEAWNTGEKVAFSKNGSSYKLERVANPLKLIRSLGKK